MTRFLLLALVVVSTLSAAPAPKPKPDRSITLRQLLGKKKLSFGYPGASYYVRFADDGGYAASTSPVVLKPETQGSWSLKNGVLTVVEVHVYQDQPPLEIKWSVRLSPITLSGTTIAPSGQGGFPIKLEPYDD